MEGESIRLFGTACDPDSEIQSEEWLHLIYKYTGLSIPLGTSDTGSEERLIRCKGVLQCEGSIDISLGHPSPGWFLLVMVLVFISILRLSMICCIAVTCHMFVGRGDRLLCLSTLCFNSLLR